MNEKSYTRHLSFRAKLELTHTFGAMCFDFKHGDLHSSKFWGLVCNHHEPEEHALLRIPQLQG